MDVVLLIIERAGGVCELAKALGIHHSSVIQWRKAGRIPVGRVASIEALTGIPRERLRPDIFLPDFSFTKNKDAAA